MTAVRMVEYLPTFEVLRIHFLGEKSFLEVRVSQEQARTWLMRLATPKGNRAVLEEGR